jgi:hypothetical protein
MFCALREHTQSPSHPCCTMLTTNLTCRPLLLASLLVLLLLLLLL